MSLPVSPHPFRPRLLEALRDYSRPRFLADLGAGVTVGIVALPLAMAFAIASGVKPEQGIFTAIIAGFLISLLGGSSVQIGGPAGAFIVIVYGIVQRYGVPNLLIATVLAGLLLFALGWLRLGVLVGPVELMKWVRRVLSPYSVNSLALACLPPALEDTAYLDWYVGEVNAARGDVERALDEMQVRRWPSKANFVLVKT